MSRRNPLPKPEAVDLALVIAAIFCGMVGVVYAIQSGATP